MKEEIVNNPGLWFLGISVIANLFLLPWSFKKMRLASSTKYANGEYRRGFRSDRNRETYLFALSVMMLVLLVSLFVNELIGGR
ncbi:hypothetical protein K8Q93_02630 [Candidatus Parcubacteria bacterium]|nr:hypothetical protein [Candidatus Parcubacteria bacterium]